MLIVGFVGVLLGLVFPSSLGGVMPSFTSGNAGNISDMGAVFGKAITTIPDLLSDPMAYAVIFTLSCCWDIPFMTGLPSALFFIH
jgi:hypothetical protein